MQIRWLGKAAADDGEAYTGLLGYAAGETLVRNGVHRHGDRAAEEAPEKGGDPFA